MIAGHLQDIVHILLWQNATNGKQDVIIVRGKKIIQSAILWMVQKENCFVG